MKLSTHAGRALALALVTSACAKSEPGAEPPGDRAKLQEADMVKVVSVVKGDEVRVQAEGKSARLRLVGIYAMDDVAAADPTATESLAASLLQSEIVGKVVTLHLATPPEDAHGRYLGSLDVGGRDLGLSLLEGGRVIAYTEFPFDRESLYLRAESAARAGKRGIWRKDTLVATARGLRKQWSEARSQGGAAAADDELLAPAPAAPQ
ncbi:MAG: thermonuclease family protein [Deltaproteobacteria bacterium]|nr:thermonuclease family protein [Deltaproteobacteria bacterium]